MHGRMFFEIIPPITDIETIAKGTGIRMRKLLIAKYGGKNWRKKKGRALVRLPGGRVIKAEIHWYEAHGIEKKDFKIKREIK